MKELLKASQDVLLVELNDGTAVLLHLGTKFYFTLNPTGLTVWKALAATEAGVSPQHLIESLTRHHQVDSERAARDLDPLLAEMRVEGLVAAVS